MLGWKSVMDAALRSSQEEDDVLSEAERLREASDSDSEPSVVPTSSQTSDEPLPGIL